MKRLYAKNGQLALKNCFYRTLQSATGLRRPVRLIWCRCVRMDAIDLEYLFAGARMRRDMLRGEGHETGRKHVTARIRGMGIDALYRRPNISKPNLAHRIYPYLLKELAIERARDITYIAMAKGSAYLGAVMDCAGRRVFGWRLSNTMTADVLIEALQEAVARDGTPEIMNADQGSQFSSSDSIGILNANKIPISINRKDCWRNSLFVERLWKLIKYENVYLHAYEGVSQAKAGIGKFLAFHSEQRPHSSLDGRTPDAVYFRSSSVLARAA